MLTVPNVSKGQTMNVLHLLVILKKKKKKEKNSQWTTNSFKLTCIIAWVLHLQFSNNHNIKTYLDF